MYGCEYSYIEENSDTNISDSGEVSHTATFEINAVCPYCGAEKEIHKKFTQRKGGQLIGYQIDRYCRDLFRYKDKKSK